MRQLGTRRGRRAPAGRLLVAAVALAATVVVLGPAGSAAANPNVYSNRAGFAHAKLSAPDPSPILVWKPPDWAIRLNAAVRRWDEQAGRRLFARTADRSAAEVVLTDGAGVGWAVACYDAAGAYGMRAAYARCLVFVAYTGATRSTTWTLVHELGHTLGFVDHVPAADYRRYVRWGLDPRVCDDPTHPAYSRYDGIMSACQGTRDSFRGDAAALVRAGYAALVAAS
jgi:hypothetical protein